MTMQCFNLIYHFIKFTEFIEWGSIDHYIYHQLKEIQKAISGQFFQFVCVCVMLGQIATELQV